MPTMAEIRVRRATGGGRARLAGRALLALVAGVAAAATPALAQQATAGQPARAPQAALTPQAELAATQRSIAQVEQRMHRLVTELAGREPSPSTLDSLMRLENERRTLVTRAALLQSRLNFRAVEVEARRQASPSADPQGWFGVYTTSDSEGVVTAGGQVVVTSRYPMVRTVEPGSPAARAGLRAGDRLVTIRGLDMRDLQQDTASLARLLRPGATLPVRILRDGQAREVAVAITSRPTSFGPAAFSMSVRSEAGEGGATQVRVSGSAPAASPRAVTVQRAPSPTTYLFSRTADVLPVAGAEVMRLTDGLRSTHGVERGLFVVSVLPRTPAEQAGLRAGDVLVVADGRALEQPQDFLLVVQRQNAGDRTVKIELVRGKRGRVVEMKW